MNSRRSMTHCVGLLVLCSVLATGTHAQAQLCADSDLNAELQYMRRLSLDLRGTMPSVAEYQQVIDAGVMPETFVDDALDSEDFEHQYARFLRDLLQVGLGDNTAQNVVNTLSVAPGTDIYWMTLRGTLYRGGTMNTPCLDEPATFTGATIDTQCSNGVCREGWVLVTPFWDPSTQVKVCAFDAQVNVVGTYGPCDENNYDSQCGCGDNLDLCYRVDVEPAVVSKTAGVIYHRTEWAYIDAMKEQVTRIGTRILAQDLPYTDLITTSTIEFNGPLYHLVQKKPRIPYYPDIDVTTFIGPITPLDYTEKDTWVEAEMQGAGAAGVLTSPFYLLRNASNRSRANRFYQSFLCKDFVGPPDGLPPPADPLALTPNLMVREGCDYCHQELEPAAAHWGRWHKIGMGYYDGGSFPDERPECVGSLDPTCALYLTEASHADEEPYLGYFKTLVFSDTTLGNGDDAIQIAVDGGPRALADKAIDDGLFAACTTNKVWTWIMGREPASIDGSELAWLTTKFVDDGYDFKALVSALVASDAYRDHLYVQSSKEQP